MKTWTFKDGSKLTFTEPDGSDPLVGLQPNALTQAITNLNDNLCALIDRRTEECSGWGDAPDSCDEQDELMTAIMTLVVVILTTDKGGR